MDPVKTWAPPPFFLFLDRELSAVGHNCKHTVSEPGNEFRQTIRYWLGIVDYTRLKTMEQKNIVVFFFFADLEHTWHCAYFA